MNLAVHIPEATTINFIGLDSLEHTPVRQVARYWAARCGVHRFPSRDDIRLRDIANTLRYMSLLKVLDNDFLYRVVGDATVRAYAVPLHNRRLSEVEREAPKYGAAARQMFTRVVETREPVCVRGGIGRDFPDANFTEFENAFLPLGSDHEHVDHLLTVSTYSMQPSRF